MAFQRYAPRRTAATGIGVDLLQYLCDLRESRDVSARPDYYVWNCKLLVERDA